MRPEGETDTGLNPCLELLIDTELQLRYGTARRHGAEAPVWNCKARLRGLRALIPSPSPCQRKHILLRFECVPFYFVPQQGEGRRKDIVAFALLPGEARSKRSRTRSTRSGTCRLSKQDVPPLGGGRVGMRAQWGEGSQDKDALDSCTLFIPTPARIVPDCAQH